MLGVADTFQSRAIFGSWVAKMVAGVPPSPGCFSTIPTRPTAVFLMTPRAVLAPVVQQAHAYDFTAWHSPGCALVVGHCLGWPEMANGQSGARAGEQPRPGSALSVRVQVASIDNRCGLFDTRTVFLRAIIF
jgi:hypothetical protein